MHLMRKTSTTTNRFALPVSENDIKHYRKIRRTKIQGQIIPGQQKYLMIGEPIIIVSKGCSIIYRCWLLVLWSNLIICCPILCWKLFLVMGETIHQERCTRYAIVCSVLCAKKVFMTRIGLSLKQADLLTAEQETILWDMCLLGNRNSQAVINTIFFYNLRNTGIWKFYNLCVGKPMETHLLNIVGGFQISNHFAGGLQQRNLLAKTIQRYSESGTPGSLYVLFVHG